MVARLPPAYALSLSKQPGAVYHSPASWQHLQWVPSGPVLLGYAAMPSPWKSLAKKRLQLKCPASDFSTLSQGNPKNEQGSGIGQLNTVLKKLLPPADALAATDAAGRGGGSTPTSCWVTISLPVSC